MGFLWRQQWIEQYPGNNNIVAMALMSHQTDWLLTCCCFCRQGQGHLCTNKWASPRPSALCKQYEQVHLAAQGEDNRYTKTPTNIDGHARLHCADLQSSFCGYHVKSKASTCKRLALRNMTYWYSKPTWLFELPQKLCPRDPDTDRFRRRPVSQPQIIALKRRRRGHC